MKTLNNIIKDYRQPFNEGLINKNAITKFNLYIDCNFSGCCVSSTLFTKTLNNLVYFLITKDKSIFNNSFSKNDIENIENIDYYKAFALSCYGIDKYIENVNVNKKPNLESIDEKSVLSMKNIIEFIKTFDLKNLTIKENINNIFINENVFYNNQVLYFFKNSKYNIRKEEILKTIVLYRIGLYKKVFNNIKYIKIYNFLKKEIYMINLDKILFKNYFSIDIDILGFEYCL